MQGQHGASEKPVGAGGQRAVSLAQNRWEVRGKRGKCGKSATEDRREARSKRGKSADTAAWIYPYAAATVPAVDAPLARRNTRQQRQCDRLSSALTVVPSAGTASSASPRSRSSYSLTRQLLPRNDLIHRTCPS